MRDKYNEQLEELNKEMIEMGSMCETAINTSIRTMMEYGMQIGSHPDCDVANDIALKSEQLRQSVYKIDSEIDQKEREIENLCVKLLLCQQPVASDLRLVSAAMKMVSDMERIGDQASDIAELVDYIKDGKLQVKIHINEMAKEASNMVTQSIDSFVGRDIELAKKVIAYDDLVDEFFIKIKNDLIKDISAGDTMQAECSLDMLMIAKYLERIADHATNIAEWVVYSVTGETAMPDQKKPQ